MVASTDIKYYVHTNTNAPQLTNNFGCMIDVLDACLVNGFGSQTVSTLTASSTTVTATFGSAHNFMQYQVIKIAGATQTEYNGEFRILTVPNANSITFQLVAEPSVTTATGTITCSLPPIGWLKPFSGTGKAAYRSSNTLLASRPYLRVVDALDPAYTATYAKYAKVGIVEDMTDIDTMLGVQAPYDSANPNKNWVGTGSGTSAYNGWAKWVYATSQSALSGQNFSATPSNGNRRWIIVGNQDYFYVFNELIPSDTGRFVLYGFGSFDSVIPNDTSNTLLSSWANYQTVSTSQPTTAYVGLTRNVSDADTLIVNRKYDQSTAYAQLKVPAQTLAGSNTQATGTSNFVPASANGIPVYSTDIPAYESAISVPRGTVKGLRWLHQLTPYTHSQMVTEDGEIYMAVNVAASSLGQILVRIA